jgi:hypothetical protein
MITPPDGWWLVRRAGEFVLGPAGSTTPAARYRECLRPIGVPIELAAAGFPPDFSASSIACTRLLTDEGEHAALVVARGECDARPVELSVGFVILDESYAELRAGPCDPADGPVRRDAITKMIVTDRHFLGPVRRRRFVYEPPAGWHGLGGRFEATWYPHAYPRHRASITVGPALPTSAALAEAIVAMVRGDDGVLIGATVDVGTPRGLIGQMWHLWHAGSPPRATYLTILVDDDFLYPARLDSVGTPEADLECLHQLLASIEPIPRPARRQRPARDDERFDALRYWAD